MKDREKENAKGKSDRKSDRKKARALNILKNDTGISESPAPTCTLFICNAGLTTGCSTQNLLPVFSPYGTIQSIVLIPAKSYSFVVFRSIESAVQCMDGVNGKIGVDEDGLSSGGNKAGISGPLYLSYVDHAPPQVQDNWCEKLPSGLEVLEAFISSQEEKELLGLFDWTESSSLDGAMKHRQVKHFGYEFNYTTNNIDPNLPLEAKIPDLCLDICQRAVEKGLIDVLPDQLTINRYLPGQGIPPHTDTHSCCTSTILSLSLGSSTVMQFRGPGAKLVSVLLPAKSLLVMSGESRYAWTHGITPHKHDVVKDKDSGGLTLLTRGERVSLTFRKTLGGPCVCSYPLYCDSVAKESRDTQQGKEAVEEDTAAKLEALHVHQVYETIADHFSDTRHKPWPQVLEFLKMLDPGSVLLDLGCGNGKYLGQEGSESRMEIGMDYSQGLLDIVVQRGHQACRSDLLFVPCRDSVADGIICIAALHHLSTTVRRLSSLREMTRVLAPGGKFLIYVWAKDQRKGEASSYLKQNKKNFKKSQVEVKVEEEIGQFGLPVHVNRTQFKHQDLLVPWKLKNEKTPEICENSPVFQRYYHVFEEGELEGLIGQIDQLTVIRSYYDQGNHCVIAQKI